MNGEFGTYFKQGIRHCLQCQHEFTRCHNCGVNHSRGVDDIGCYEYLVSRGRSVYHHFCKACAIKVGAEEAPPSKPTYWAWPSVTPVSPQGSITATISSHFHGELVGREVEAEIEAELDANPVDQLMMDRWVLFLTTTTYPCTDWNALDCHNCGACICKIVPDTKAQFYDNACPLHGFGSLHDQVAPNSIVEYYRNQNAGTPTTHGSEQ